MNEETRQAVEDIAERMTERLADSHKRAVARLGRDRPVHNVGAPAAPPMVVSTGTQTPFTFDYRAFGEALATALTPTFNAAREQAEKIETLIEQVAQLAQAIAGMEIRPTINVPQSAVNVELPAPRSFVIEHEDGTKSKVTVG